MRAGISFDSVSRKPVGWNDYFRSRFFADMIPGEIIMKLVWIVPHFPPHIGGGEKLYHDVCIGLMERGCEVRVLTSNSGGVTGYHDVDGIDVYYFSWKLMFGHPVVKSSDIREHIKWSDIVHTTIFSTAMISNRIARSEGKPCVTTLHEVMGRKWFWFEHNPLKAAAFRVYESMIVHQTKAVHVVSNATLKDYQAAKKNGGRAYMIYNFPDLPAISVIENEDITFRKCFGLTEGMRGILYFGRPAPNKGIFVLLKAIKILADKGTLPDSVRFCMILAPNPSSAYGKAIRIMKKHGIEDHMIVRPSMERNRLLKVLSGADCCVIPSITEGFGYTAVETCYYKVPVICSNGGSLPEVVSGKCLFFENRDPNDLAEKIDIYIREELVLFDNIEEKHFDREEILDKYLEMYEDMLKA